MNKIEITIEGANEKDLLTITRILRYALVKAEVEVNISDLKGYYLNDSKDAKQLSENNIVEIKNK